MWDPPAKNSGERKRKDKKSQGDSITLLNQRSETVTKQFSVVTSSYTAATKPQLFSWLLATEQRVIVLTKKKKTKKPQTK